MVLETLSWKKTVGSTFERIVASHNGILMTAFLSQGCDDMAACWSALKSQRLGHTILGILFHKGHPYSYRYFLTLKTIMYALCIWHDTRYAVKISKP